ncbi:FXL16 protein, partial [Notiomystis cincta]|nr:FXL16 protein [Notiomystis cincta]NXB03974.1 FXL16 protein [Cnemophilus loriae]
MSSLRSLYLRWCCQVQDFGLKHLLGMGSLRLLSLAGCPLLTTTGLSGLVQLQELEELELTNCPGATPELFKYFSQHLPCCMVIE